MDGSSRVMVQRGTILAGIQWQRTNDEDFEGILSFVLRALL